MMIQNLERKEKNQAAHLEQLSKKQIFLKWRCEQLITYNEALSKRRSGIIFHSTHTHEKKIKKIVFNCL